MDVEKSAEEFRQDFDLVRRELGKVIVGCEAIVDGVLTGLLKDGRVDELVESLLEHYYDPLYVRSEKGREHDATMDSTDPTACAEELVAWIEASKG